GLHGRGGRRPRAAGLSRRAGGGPRGAYRGPRGRERGRATRADPGARGVGCPALPRDLRLRLPRSGAVRSRPAHRRTLARRAGGGDRRTGAPAIMTIAELVERVRGYTPTAPVEVIQKAYEFSAEVHKGQRRASGEPYLTHPLQVASIIADMRLDVPSIATGLLH